MTSYLFKGKIVEQVTVLVKSMTLQPLGKVVRLSRSVADRCIAAFPAMAAGCVWLRREDWRGSRRGSVAMGGRVREVDTLLEGGREGEGDSVGGDRSG